MRFKGNVGTTEAAIAGFESRIGFDLTTDYRLFLKSFNGGGFEGGYPELTADVVGAICHHQLFGLGMRHRAIDLAFWHEEMRGEMPPKAILIGNDPGGAFFLLSCDEADQKVYLYDHAYRYPTSSDTRNGYVVADRFNEFLEAVGVNA